MSAREPAVAFAPGSAVRVKSECDIPPMFRNGPSRGWECGAPLTPENAPRVEGGIECQSCLTVWAVPEEAERDA